MVFFQICQPVYNCQKFADIVGRILKHALMKKLVAGGSRNATILHSSRIAATSRIDGYSLPQIIGSGLFTLFGLAFDHVPIVATKGFARLFACGKRFVLGSIVTLHQGCTLCPRIEDALFATFPHHIIFSFYHTFFRQR